MRLRLLLRQSVLLLTPPRLPSRLLLKKLLLLKRLRRQRKLLPSKSRQTILHLESSLGLRLRAIFFLGGGDAAAPVG